MTTIITIIMTTITKTIIMVIKLLMIIMIKNNILQKVVIVCELAVKILETLSDSKWSEKIELVLFPTLNMNSFCSQGCQHVFKKSLETLPSA